uniref:CHHC U11-48K-type domain-containing protein n=1 Tax=Eptatretus burgeri TaxID=7764 RepID=A0A8C4Q1U9_EPTBU
MDIPRSCASSYSEAAECESAVLLDGRKFPHMGVTDPDETFPCPYNKNHIVRASRFPYHLIKCKKNFPLIAREMGTCPFNARHLLPKPEMQNHLMVCPDKCRIHQDISFAMEREEIPLSEIKDRETNSMLEDWDEEMQDPHVFVWGQQNFCKGDNFSNLNKHMRKVYKQQLKHIIIDKEKRNLYKL